MVSPAATTGEISDTNPQVFPAPRPEQAPLGRLRPAAAPMPSSPASSTRSGWRSART